jgi:DNA-binding IclR family transcriptional regulator
VPTQRDNVDLSLGPAAGSGTQLLDRALAIIELLGDAGYGGETTFAISERLNLTQSTVRRILKALERGSFVIREGGSRHYKLGLALFALGAKAAEGTGLRAVCRQSLLRISAETGDTTFLMARNGFNAVCVDRQEGSYVIDSLTRNIGGQIPLGVAPASQAILAFIPQEESDLILERNSGRYAAFRDLTAGEIRARLPIIRERGYALDHSRLVDGISALAVPIIPKTGNVTASISINATTPRLPDERVPKLLDLMRREIDSIKNSLVPT